MFTFINANYYPYFWSFRLVSLYCAAIKRRFGCFFAGLELWLVFFELIWLTSGIKDIFGVFLSFKVYKRCKSSFISRDRNLERKLCDESLVQVNKIQPHLGIEIWRQNLQIFLELSTVTNVFSYLDDLSVNRKLLNWELRVAGMIN